MIWFIRLWYIYIYMLTPPRSTFCTLLSAQSSTRKLFAQLKRKSRKNKNKQKNKKNAACSKNAKIQKTSRKQKKTILQKSGDRVNRQESWNVVFLFFVFFCFFWFSRGFFFWFFAFLLLQESWNIVFLFFLVFSRCFGYLHFYFCRSPGILFFCFFVFSRFFEFLHFYCMLWGIWACAATTATVASV